MNKHRRRIRLTTAARKPKRRAVQTFIYERNLDIAAKLLDRVSEIRNLCQHKAPFHRPDSRPFLEIHHIVRLADDGDDTVDNVVAV